MIWELLRARLRLVVLTAVAAGLAGCSSERFTDNRYNDNRYSARPAPEPEPMGAAAMAPSSRIEQAPLPPPSGMSGPVSGPVSVAPDAGYSGGGRAMGMASYQPTSQPAPVPPEITGSAAPRKPASPWSWEGCAAPRRAGGRAHGSKQPAAGRRRATRPAAGHSALHGSCAFFCCTIADREQRGASVSRARGRNRSGATRDCDGLVRPARRCGW